MLLEGNSDIVQSIEIAELKGQYHEILHFFNGKALVIGQTTIALFKNRSLIDDPLGNGLISLSSIPTDSHFQLEAKPWVTGHQSGYVGLSNQGALLILPNAIRLYHNREDALRNSNMVLELSFE